VLTDGQVIDRYPKFSPDGRRLSFTCDRLGHEEIWTLDPVTRRQERLQLPGKDLGSNESTWFRDGRQIAVTRFHEGGAQSMWIAAMDGGHAEELLPPAQRSLLAGWTVGPLRGPQRRLPAGADWSPDGRSSR